MNYYLYLIKGGGFNRFYIGISSNLKRRLSQHNSGDTKSTKPYRPWKLIYFEVYKSRGEASKREYFLKHPRGYLTKLSIIKEHGEVAERLKAAVC